MHIHGTADRLIRYADCPEGRNVVLMTVDGGGHEWPSFATQALWQFFAAH